ncbi:MAG: hypothetical protein ACTSVK_15805 [Promethearchaeota archaeon]
MIIDDIRTFLLAAFGNAFLNGKDVSLDNGHPVAYGFYKIKFVQNLPGKQIGWINYLAKNPNLWFRYLKYEGYKRLYLIYRENSDSNWKILAVKDDKYDIWSYKVVFQQETPKFYYYIEKTELDTPEIKVVPLEEAKIKLKKMLQEMIAFTVKAELRNWQLIFERALSLLAIKRDNQLLVKGFFPEGCYKIEAKQIIATCDEAWVFGGMGSWNDINPGHYAQEYDQLSVNLYSTICASIVSAINSYPE